jgi:hypothetical protein
MAGVMEDGTIVCDTPESINAFRLLALKGALRLETIGLKRRGMPASEIVRQEIGSKIRNKVALLAEYEKWLRAKGILR